MSLTVAASLWSTPKDRLDSEALRLAAAGLRRWHWDVSDGVLAAPGGFDVDTVERLTRLALSSPRERRAAQPLGPSPQAGSQVAVLVADADRHAALLQDG